MNEETFVFYGSWINLLQAFPKEEDKKEFLWNVFLIGTGNEIETDNPAIIGIINGAILPNMKAAKGRYKTAVENGSKGGRKPKEFDTDKALQLHDSGKTYQEIAEIMGVSKNTVGERIRSAKTKNQKPEPETTKNLYKEKENETEKENDYEYLIDKVGCDGSFNDTWIDTIYPKYYEMDFEQKVAAWSKEGFNREEAIYIINTIMEDMEQ